MTDIFKKSKSIKEEAGLLLHNFNLVNMLKCYGEVRFTGSFELDLMLKKDIDISLINDNLTVKEFTELGKLLIDKLNTPSVYYRNTRITPAERRPENSLYWGIKTGEWFLDIWAMSSKVYQKADRYIRLIKSKLNEDNRFVILNLKNELMKNNTYGQSFGSRELYDAVLNYNVTTIAEFTSYINIESKNNNYI